jgi:hypothetical protein
MLRVFNANGETLRAGIDQLRRIDLNEEGFLPGPKPGPYR